MKRFFQLSTLISVSTTRRVLTGLFLILMSAGISSCLSVEKKEYTFVLTGNNSGILTIKYVNIYSIKDDGQDTSIEDFKELIDKYINGDQIAQDFPGATNIKKRLFEENGTLCGEVTLEFNDLNSARLYQYDKNSPIMMNITTTYDSETYIASNGEYGNEHMPVVFWPAQAKTLEVSTSVSTPDENSISLIDAYRIWISRK